MNNSQNQLFKADVLKSVKYQFIFTIIFLVFLYFFLNETSFISVLVGYFVSLTANTFFFIQFLILKFAKISSIAFLFGLLTGEIIKIFFILISLYIISNHYIYLDWFYVILSLIFSLKLHYANIFINH